MVDARVTNIRAISVIRERLATAARLRHNAQKQDGGCQLLNAGTAEVAWNTNMRITGLLYKYCVDTDMAVTYVRDSFCQTGINKDASVGGGGWGTTTVVRG